jgi:hypothetical protein
MTRPPVTSRQWCCLLLTGLLFALGCGKQNANQGAVSGTVRLDGRPVEQGSMLLTPIDGTEGAVTGGTIEEGQYRLSGAAAAAVGWNRVEIRAMRKTGRMVPKPFAPVGEMVAEQVETIPP